VEIYKYLSLFIETIITSPFNLQKGASGNKIWAACCIRKVEYCLLGWGQTGRGVQPFCYTMDTGSFPGEERPGCGFDQPISSSAEVKERVELYLYSLCGPSWPVLCWTLLSFTMISGQNNPQRFGGWTCILIQAELGKWVPALVAPLDVASLSHCFGMRTSSSISYKTLVVKHRPPSLTL
jgi:hypothetical protein